MENFKGQIESITLIPSGGGVFEVDVEGSRVFSKKETDRFPEKDEVSKIIEDKNLMQRVEE
ncbi:selenoprotein W-related protein [Caldalkalibacillus uzonensis]|uniref:Selenoprotein W-related protein n=2 Tax=Caldalkalibacillus uzonensis TaxID=353224 RepID=A0ABU0CR74_9BACI|nr:selenoprotein W-related protein [Caldalkalibacillus uzonensis]